MVECPQCGDEYDYIGNHWSLSSCDYPTLSEKQKDAVTGLMMGDGSLDKTSKNPRLVVQMTTPNYLRYLDDLFGPLSTHVHLSKSSEESAEISRDSGFSLNPNPKDYSDIYQWRTRSHPELFNFDWYTGENGKKVWPESIKLTPMVLKHWYVGDGTWNNSSYRNYISISMSNERGNEDKIDSIFERSGIPKPSNYAWTENDNGDKGCIAQFTKSDSEVLWEFMGRPLPDFEYKWPQKFHHN
jgi:hypothetical protein